MWIVRLVQGMYANARGCVRFGDGYSEEFAVKVGVHQGSVLSPLLFIIVLEALSREFRTSVPLEDLYADDLVIITDSLDECVKRLLIWKEAMERKGLRVNAGKTKIMTRGTGVDLLQDSGSFPCAVCRTAGGCDLATTTRVKTAWKKFKELLPVLTSRHLSCKTRGRVYNTCVRSAMLHASEIWALTKPNLHRLLRQICNIKPEDMATVGSTELLGRLGIDYLDLILRERRLRWYGHVVRSSSAVKYALNLQVPGRRRVGRSMLSWRKLTEKDRREWKLSTADPQDRKKWRYEVRSDMRAASQISGRGPTSVEITRNPARK
ncbi:uncharacterized protein LOC125664425 [Ostrea edulis]|uniref:uncharacterized protein LOC125664425 n=1 Tax=Ostrea edulis TaxID=37623 RepID=UPI0024AE977C|nr:uncharacterized protein LOC125664425 [Ostrea edulis]